jgi:hypothetical protein
MASGETVFSGNDICPTIQTPESNLNHGDFHGDFQAINPAAGLAYGVVRVAPSPGAGLREGVQIKSASAVGAKSL